jgi:anti-anti-sigma factor
MTDARKWGLTATRSGAAGPATIALTGRISHANAPSLAEALDAAVAAGNREIVVDLAGVDYVSSTGLEGLRRISERLTALGGRLVLAAAQPPVKIALELAGILPRQV